MRKIATWLMSALALVVFALGFVFLPKVNEAKAESTAVTFSSAVLGDDKNDTYGTSVRFDTAGLQWNEYKNWLNTEEWKSLSDYTMINGRTVTEINEMTTSSQKITLMLQPAGSFSFFRVYLPESIMSLGDVKSMQILNGWSFTSGENTYTSSAVTFLRSGGAMFEVSAYNAETKISESEITISEATLTNPQDAAWGVDSYFVDINIGRNIASEFDTMYDGYKSIRNFIYINGKSIEQWNAELIAEDARFNNPSSYTRFPQNSTDPGHLATFVKPIGFWGTATGFCVSIYQELLADCSTVEVRVGAGCMLAGKFMVTGTVSKTVLTQTPVDITKALHFLDNSNNAPAAWGETNMYYIHTNDVSYWTKSPKGGCLNECDPQAQGGGQIQMKYIYFNGKSLWDINKEDDGAYASTQDNIVNGGVYAPILVTMSDELGSTLKLTVPTAFDLGMGGHKEIVLKKGFSVKEGDKSFYLTNDVVFTNNNGTWTTTIKPLEEETEVTNIITYANRTDGGTNENFVLFQLSNNDYDGLNTTAIKDISSLFGYIDIDGNVVNSQPSEPFFNVWGYANTIAFRAPGLSAEGLQNVKYITIKAGAKFPSYDTQYNDGKPTYFVTKEDVTFVHDGTADSWSKGYSVTFKANGEVFATQGVLAGGVASAFTSNPTKAEDDNYYYDFAGWVIEGTDTAFGFENQVNENLVLEAKFTAVAKRTVAFVSEGVDFDKAVVKSGNAVSAPATVPTKASTDTHTFSFIGWYNGETAWNFDTAVTEDMTLTAKFEAVEKAKFAVTFDSDNGETATVVYVYDGLKVEKPATVPTKAPDGATNYTFVCWSADGANAFDFNTPITGEITLKAVYTTKQVYAVTINGEVSYYEEGSKVTKPVDPVKDADENYTYTFVGWYNGETAWNFDTDVVASNMELVAKYNETKIEYNLVVNNYNPMTGESLTITLAWGEAVTVEVPTAVGMNFLGYANETQIPATMPVGGLEVFAVWEVIPYTVKVVDLNNAETVYTFGVQVDAEAGIEYTLETIATAVVLPALPTPANGYTNAWDNELPEAWELRNYEFKMVSTMNVYTITFECEVGEVEAITFTVETYENIVLPAVPAKEGFTGKWNKTVDQLLFEDVTLTAVYTAIPVENPENNSSTGSEDVDDNSSSSDTALPGEVGIVDKVKDTLGCSGVVGGFAGGIVALGIAVATLLKKKED